MFELRKLPFEKEAIASFISAETLEFHYGKHHQTYINNLNKLVEGSQFDGMNLVDIILKSEGGMFNNAAQVFNHDFYWDCISANSQPLSAELQEAINVSFGDLENFKSLFVDKATTLFASGWCWLVYDVESTKLEIVQTSNAQTPMKDGKIPLLVVDVWEHAYYIDFRNVRPNYLSKFWDFINWGFVSERLNQAKLNGLDSIRSYVDHLYR
ncbi:superoxide dismutase [Helicobacter enhydrae]|uniref:Superoxide dismutase n=1 Tax=Helicobacter enhydrae TaxID=222136 RepID=A0A1B1U3N2_9HELI|nr:superoxide dismutase [Helicobacter enhydrae]ANV97359.1 superoxide dismutase [Helicobacter enhydrae]